MQLKHSITLVDELGNRREGRPGDWLVTGVNSRQYIVEQNVFEQSYEVVEEQK